VTRYGQPMSEGESKCHVCGRAGGDARFLPRRDGAGAFTAEKVCETCVMGAVDELRAVVARAEAADDIEDDDGEAGFEFLMLHAFLATGGLEVTEELKGGVDGFAGVRQGVRALLDRLERQLMCSQCVARGPESRVRVVPAWNESAGGYVTTFRCPACLPATIDETCARVEHAAQAELDNLGAFFQRYAVFVHEWMRGDPIEKVRPLMISLVRAVGDGTMRLPLGATSSMQ
jgi:hypothetical protein